MSDKLLIGPNSSQLKLFLYFRAPAAVQGAMGPARGMHQQFTEYNGTKIKGVIPCSNIGLSQSFHVGGVTVGVGG